MIRLLANEGNVRSRRFRAQFLTLIGLAAPGAETGPDSQTPQGDSAKAFPNEGRTETELAAAFVEFDVPLHAHGPRLKVAHRFFSIPKHITGSKNVVQGGPPASDEIRYYKGILYPELKRYPDAFWKRLSIDSIVLCADLSCGNRVGGLSLFSSRSIYLDIKDAALFKDESRRAIHHELYHFLDYCDNGLLDADPTWLGLTRGQKLSRSPTDEGVNITDLQSNSKARDISEDKAIVFSVLMIVSADRSRLVPTDPTFTLKAQALRISVVAFAPELEGVIPRL